MSAPALRVSKVTGRADALAFVRLPYVIYRDDPHWVPPLRLAECRRWSPRHNPSLRTREAARWIARRGTRVVGRVAAVIDRAFADRWVPRAGFIGFFECEDDAAAAAAVLDAAHQWLQTQGAATAVGPVNLSTHDEVGLLVDGFDSPPTLLSPYNPPRYDAHLRDSGYRKARDYHAYRWKPGATVAAPVERLVRAAHRQAGLAGRVRVRHADPTRWNEEVRTLFTLYNAAFADLWGFVPIAWPEFVARATEFRQFYRPELALIAEIDGEPVGFGLLLPDVNVALRLAKGRLLPLGWLRLLRAVPQLRTGRFILTGVLPRFTGLGVAPLVAHAMFEPALRLGLTEVEVSLVQEENARMRRVIEAFGCQRTKTFRLYERAL